MLLFTVDKIRIDLLGLDSNTFLTLYTACSQFTLFLRNCSINFYYYQHLRLYHLCMELKVFNLKQISQSKSFLKLIWKHLVTTQINTNYCYWQFDMTSKEELHLLVKIKENIGKFIFFQLKFIFIAFILHPPMTKHFNFNTATKRNTQ